MATFFYVLISHTLMTHLSSFTCRTAQLYPENATGSLSLIYHIFCTSSRPSSFSRFPSFIHFFYHLPVSRFFSPIFHLFFHQPHFFFLPENLCLSTWFAFGATDFCCVRSFLTWYYYFLRSVDPYDPRFENNNRKLSLMLTCVSGPWAAFRGRSAKLEDLWSFEFKIKTKFEHDITTPWVFVASGMCWF